MKLTGLPSKERPWLKYYPQGADKVSIVEKTVYQYLLERNKRNMKRTALDHSGTKISYKTLFENIKATAKAFTATGVKRGDIVSFMLPNTPEAVYCFYALNKIGACSMVLNPNLDAQTIKEYINLTKTNVLISSADFLDEFKQEFIGIKKIIGISPDCGHISWDKFIEAGKNEPEINITYEPKSPAALVFSCGSTGKAKGILLSNETFTCFAVQADAALKKIVRKIKNMISLSMLTNMPIAFAGGLFALNYTLMSGWNCVLEPEFSSEVFVSHVRNNKTINGIYGSPGFFDELIKSGHVNLSRMQNIVVPGEVLAASLEIELNNYLKQCSFKGNIIKPWGMSESSTLTYASPRDKNSKGVGKPLPLTTISVFNKDTNEELSYNIRGELRFITPTMMLGYYKDMELTAQFIRKDAEGQIWGCTGDIGYIDEEGNVFVEGRFNDFIFGNNGEKIWMFDIEKIVMEDKAILSCEAVGIEMNGKSVPMVYLELRKDYSMESHEQIIKRVHDSCVQKLSADAVPHGYKIKDNFKIMPSGKRDMFLLKQKSDGWIISNRSNK